MQFSILVTISYFIRFLSLPILYLFMKFINSRTAVMWHAHQARNITKIIAIYH